MLMTASRLSVSMSTSGLGLENLLGLRRVGPQPRLVNAICREKHSTSTYDLRLVTGHRPLRDADVDVRCSGRQRQDALRDRQLQPQVAAVAEPELRPRREHERQLTVPGEYLANAARKVDRTERSDGSNPSGS